jgi:hypothetical protein
MQRMLDSGYRMQDVRYRIQDTGYRIQDTGYRIQDTGYRIQGFKLELCDTRVKRGGRRYKIQIAFSG